MYEKKLWAEVGGYPALNVRDDVAFFEAVQRHRNQGYVSYPIAERDRFMVLRGKSKYQHTPGKAGDNRLDSTPGKYELVPKPIADNTLRAIVNRLIMLRAASWEVEQQFTSRSETPAFPKIVFHVSDRRANSAGGVLERFDRHWPFHPQVEIVGSGTESAPANTQLASEVSDVGTNTQASPAPLLECIRSLDDPFILLWRDDQALCATPNFDLLALAWAIIRRDPDIASFHLTAAHGPHTESYPCSSDLVTLRLGDGIPVYGSLWRRECLLPFLSSIGDRPSDALTSVKRQLSGDCQMQHLGFSSQTTSTQSTGSDGQDTDHAVLPVRPIDSTVPRLGQTGLSGPGHYS
jgi:hypothetical protein